MIKDKVFDYKEKINFLEVEKINSDKILWQIQKEMIDLFTFSNYIKTQWNIDIEQILSKINDINKKYERENDFLENLYLRDASNLIFNTKSYNKKLNLTWKFTNKLNKNIKIKKWFMNIKELESNFLKPYKKYIKLTNKIIDKLNLENTFKKIWFEYSKWTDTYLKVLYLKNNLELNKNSNDIFDEIKDTFNLFLKEWIIKDIKIIKTNSMITEKIDKNEYVSFQKIMQIDIDTKNSLEIFKVIHKKIFAYVFSVKNIDSEILFNFFKKAYSLNKENYFNFSSYNSCILNVLNTYYKITKSIKYKFIHYNWVEDYIQKLFSIVTKDLTQKTFFANIVKVDVNKLEIKNNQLSYNYEKIYYPYIFNNSLNFVNENPNKLYKIIWKKIIWLNNIMLMWNKINFTSLTKEIDINYLIFWKESLYDDKKTYTTYIPYEYIKSFPEKRYILIRNYALYKAKFTYEK